MGEDICVRLAGGAPHVGGCAIASPDGYFRSLGLPGHKDALLAEYMARKLAKKLRRSVVVNCGVHYDAITQEEIKLVFELARRLAETIVGAILSSPRNT